MNINYDNIVIDGVNYLSVIKLNIEQKVNNHATALLHLIVEAEEGAMYMQGVHENEFITIGVPEPIFVGIVMNVSLSHEDTYHILKINLASTSMLWDIQRANRSYQRIGSKYSEIMNKATNGVGVIEFQDNDCVSTAMVVQYQETIWEFILRLASECGELVYVNPASKMPHVYVGLQQQNSAYQSTVVGNGTAQGKERGYVSLGEAVLTGEKISSASTNMENGELISGFSCTNMEDMTQKIKVPKFAGRVMSGVVKGVQEDKVQVHITDLDSEYDEESVVWLPYSTLYSSKENGAGIYCMPIVDDPVRVFFPTEHPKDAFVSSSYTVRGNMGEAISKCFKTPDGMTLLFAEDGLYLYSEKGVTKIYLQKNGAIIVESDQKIQIHADKNISLEANSGKIAMNSPTKVCMATGNSMISIENNGIIMASDRILTQ